jgi:hypothetical protein
MKRFRIRRLKLQARPPPHPKQVHGSLSKHQSVSGRSRERITLTPSILDAINDPTIFKPFFKDPQSWLVWKAILAAIFALPMTPEQLKLYQQVSGRTQVPMAVAKEVYLIPDHRFHETGLMHVIHLAREAL